jgi:hypothetical protein
VNTFVVGIWLNLAVDGGRPFMVMLSPIEPSVEPMASTSTSCSMRSSKSASLTSAVHMTPEEMMVLSEDVVRPARGGGVVEGAQDGLGEGVTDDGDGIGPVALDGSSSSSASSDRCSSVISGAAGEVDERPQHTPVPCISGQAGSRSGARPSSRPR